ncbi:unnamed protein product [Rotaria sp. Silwood2]|nr:unnamed protein product [Rotaria sp. Silwood2]CAF3007225.1 unnamed protein product [Rotaria sp. Silwood2]CAF3359381.1 unnamed protein product [Rotaria sp. Silwood2]CAF4029140.1 unnamed protein product [Rotaria sp. Silwood2]CAF4229029.1 unnamed protein product [Rotaria sp. Silwood2]
MLAPTIQQGAGLVNAFQALTATTIISPSELALNDTVRRKNFYNIKISNIGNKPALYKISHHGAALTTGAQEGNDQLLSQPVYSADYADVYIWPTNFKLEPGQSRMITVRFQAPRKAEAALLPIFSGFIYVSNNVDEKVAHIPYAGVVGNYKDASILVRNTPSGIVTGLLSATGDFVSNGQTMNVTASGAFPILLVTAWTSRIVFMDVISGKGNVLHGFNPSNF